MYVWENHKYGIFNYKIKLAIEKKIIVEMFPKQKEVQCKKFRFSIRRYAYLAWKSLHGSYANNLKHSRPLYSVSYIPKYENLFQDLMHKESIKLIKSIFPPKS